VPSPQYTPVARNGKEPDLIDAITAIAEKNIISSNEAVYEEFPELRPPVSFDAAEDKPADSFPDDASMRDLAVADLDVVDGMLLAKNSHGHVVITFNPEGYDGYDVSGVAVPGGSKKMTPAEARAFGLKHGIDIGVPEPAEDGSVQQKVTTASDHSSKKRERQGNVCRLCGKPVKGKGHYCCKSHKMKWTRQAAEERKTNRSSGVNIQAGTLVAGGDIVDGDKIVGDPVDKGKIIGHSQRAKRIAKAKKAKASRAKSPGTDASAIGDVAGRDKHGPQNDDDIVGRHRFP